jgi:gas vesicle protein
VQFLARIGLIVGIFIGGSVGFVVMGFLAAKKASNKCDNFDPEFNETHKCCI